MSCDRGSVKNACHMLMVLGLDTRSVYEEDFERPFLEQSADFYRVSNDNPFCSSSVSMENLVSTSTVFCKTNYITETPHVFLQKSNKINTFVKALFLVFP